MGDLHDNHCYAYFYDSCIQALVKRTKMIHDSETSGDKWIASRKRDIENIGKKLKEIIHTLDELGGTQTDVEDMHDSRNSEVVVGYNGIPCTAVDENWPSYQSIIWSLRNLEESAGMAMKELPDSRQRQALKFAARGFLHVRNHFGFDKPALTTDGEDIAAFNKVCMAAGIVLSNERYRGALSDSLKTFDPYYVEDGIKDIIFH